MGFKIYTKTGDKGKTSLIGGTKVSKSNPRIESYGTVDELNSHVGLVSDLIQDEICKNILREIQDRLFTIGSLLACDPEKQTGIKLPGLEENDAKLLESEIDRMNGSLEEMKSFILPSGHVTVSSIHIARCVCRRAERACVFLQENNQEVDKLVIIYLNRLSDYLFMLARYTAHLLQVKDVPWKPRL